MTLIFLGIVIAIVAIAALFMGLVIQQIERQSRDLERRIENIFEREASHRRARERKSKPRSNRGGLPAGSILNDFELPDSDGRKMTFSSFRGKAHSLLFLQPDCQYSADLVAELPALHDTMVTSGRSLIVVTSGNLDSNQELTAHAPAGMTILMQQADEVARSWRIPGTPGLYHFTAEGVTEFPLALGEEEVRSACHGVPITADTESPLPWHQITTRFARRFLSDVADLGVGDPAPMELLLQAVSPDQAAQIDGHRIVLLFLDNACRACKTFLPDVRRFAMTMPANTRLVVANRMTDPSQIHAPDVRGVIFSYGNSSLNRAFGTVETPSMVVIDPGGSISLPAVSGRAAVVEAMKDAWR